VPFKIAGYTARRLTAERANLCLFVRHLYNSHSTFYQSSCSIELSCISLHWGESIDKEYFCCAAVALAFREQVAEGSVPKTENDIDMDVLILPGETIGCSARGKAALAARP